jgi:hypothetical protein
VDNRRRSRIEIDSGQAVQCCQVKKIYIFKIEDEKVGRLTSFFMRFFFFLDFAALYLLGGSEKRGIGK